ncbi:protein kinase domain-containing protein [Rhodococcus sp. NPDC055024]
MDNSETCKELKQSATMNFDPFETQHDVGDEVVAELSAAGFDNAQEIGRGGFGTVYRCRQTNLDRTVAVKMLTTDLHDNRERFYREQRAMGQLTGHPNIVGVMQVGETTPGHPYLVMQYYRQGSLDARIRSRGPLTVEESLGLGVKIAGALESAHRIGIIHRDVKPGNILFTDFGEPLLADFGIARSSGGFQTSAGIVTGSPAFTSPEALDGEAPTAASDVYGLGSTLFCALTGHAAFERRSGENLVAQFLRITKQNLPDLRQSGLPDDVTTAVEASLHRNPAQRPTAASLGQHLLRVQIDHGFSPSSMVLPPGPDNDSAPRRRSSSEGKEAVAPEIGNLPIDVTRFVGRRAQLSKVKNALPGTRLVTLTGMGGMGKTRLALQVAQKARRSFAGGVWFVDLSELRDAALLVDVVASTLGVRNQGARPTREVLVDFLSVRQMLLILDNCEQVVEAVANLVESLIRLCPRITVLVTSRESLSIAGETLVPVAPLTFPSPSNSPSYHELAQYDAVTLFAERAAAAVPGFELTKDNGLVVAQLCARLDGLPLAIELAAARLRTMSPEQILARLDDRYVLLSRGTRCAPTRQQTLSWCVGWSYDLCTLPERQLWVRLSAFAGGFEMDAVEYVCEIGPNLMDLLSGLVEKSVLIREETNGVIRFRMLETVHDYGSEKAVSASGYGECRRRHSEWYRQMAVDAEVEWISSRQLEWIARLERELSNIRKALEFAMSEENPDCRSAAAALYPFWLARGRFSEGRYWMSRALACPPDEPSLDRAKVLHTDALLAAHQDDLPMAITRLKALRDVTASLNEPVAIAVLDITDGYTSLLRGDFEHAGVLLQRAVDGLGESNEHLLRLRAQLSLGFALILGGNNREAFTCLEGVFSYAEANGETVNRAVSRWAQGLCLWQQGDYGQSGDFVTEGLRLADAADDKFTAVHCLEGLACIARGKEEARRAVVLMSAADQLGRAMGSPSIMFPSLLISQREGEAKLNHVMGKRAFDAARAQGSSMSLFEAIRFALDDDHPSDKPLTGEPLAKLTRREFEIASLVADGCTNKEIAAQLFISPRTVHGHVSHILEKLMFTSRAQVAAWIVGQTQNDA